MTLLGLMYYIVTMSLSRTISAIIGNFSQKSPIFPPHVFNVPAEKVPLGIWYRRKGQKPE